MSKLILTIKSALSSLVSLLFPSKCPACGAVVGSDSKGELCKGCFASFSAEFTSLCPVCKRRPSECGCVPKLVRSESDISPFTEFFPLIFSGYYTGYDENSIISTLVYKMKQNPSSQAGALFARMIAQALSRDLTIKGIDPRDLTVTFIPRSKVSVKKYGFDHMESVSKRVAEMLGCRHDAVFKRIGGDVQKNLSAVERYSNASKSIVIDPKKKDFIRGTKFIILDDVITTGSSMRVSISKLSFAGASVIIPASALISMKPKEK